MAEPANDELGVKQLWVVTGKVMLEDEKPGVQFQVIQDDGTLGDTRVYGILKAYMKRFRPGIIYEVEFYPESRRASLGSAQWKGTWSNEGERAAWRVQWDMFEAAALLRKREKDAKQRNFLREFLLPLRQQYAKTNHQGQMVMELLVLKALRSHPMFDVGKREDEE